MGVRPMQNLLKTGFLTAAWKRTKIGFRSGHSLYIFKPSSPPPPTHTDTHTHAHARTHARTHTRFELSRVATGCPLWAGAHTPQIWTAHQCSAQEQNSATSLAKAAARSPEAGAQAEHQAPLHWAQPEDENKALIVAWSPLTVLVAADIPFSVLDNCDRWVMQIPFCALPDGPGVGKNGDGVRPVKKSNAYWGFVEANSHSTLDKPGFTLTRTKIQTRHLASSVKYRTG